MSRKAFQNLFLIIFLIFLGVASGILGQILPARIQESLKNISFFGLPNEMLWAAAIILVVLLTTAATFLKERANSDLESSKVPTQSKGESERRTFLADLLDRYDKRLAHKLDGRSELPLVITDESDHAKSFQTEEAGEYLIRRFKSRGRLLLVGKPGSGKTTLLLKLAKDLVLKAQEDAKEPFPVVLNLASWSTRHTDFHLWVRDMLTKGYGVSSRFAQEFLDAKQLTFFLDGLDELARNEESEKAAKIRVSCLSALDKALHHGSLSVVICCRADELELLRQQPELQMPWVAEIVVHELTAEQIDLALIRASAAKADRFSASNLNKELGSVEAGIYQHVLSTPFYFTTALNVFDATESPIADATNRASLESHMVSAFIEKKLQKTKNRYRFNKASTLKWTTWLSDFLSVRVSFELSDLQPSSLRHPSLYKCTYTLLCGVIVGLVIELHSRQPSLGIMFGVLFGFIGAYSITDDFGRWTLTPLKRLRIWMIAISISWTTAIFILILLLVARINTVGIRRALEISDSLLIVIGIVPLISIGALVASLIISLDIHAGLGLVMGQSSPILTEDFGKWTLSSLIDRNRWRKVARLGFEGGLAGSFILNASSVVAGIVVFFYAVYLTVRGRLLLPKSEELFAIVAIVPIIIIFLAIAGFLVGVMFGATTGIVGLCREPARFVSIKFPYQRLRAGVLLNILQTEAVWWLFRIFALILIVPFHLRDLMKIFNAADLFPFNFRLFVIFGLLGLLRTPIFKHLVLRTCLSLEGAIPFRYARFLNYVTDLGILEKEGGQWRFRHQILQAHFTPIKPQIIKDE